MAFDNLFKPIQIGTMTVPNRVCHVPTDISSGDSDGQVNERVIAYYEEVAKGGCGLVIVGASTPDSNTGRPTVTCLSVDADYFIPGLHMLASSMQRHGAKCAVQIQHPGRQAVYPRKNQISCSDMISHLPGSAGHEIIYEGDTAHGKIAREMSVEEIYDLIEKFAEAAWRVQHAGFDAVELHAAHGYMIAQFMSPYTNKRNDRFGGSLQCRMRFVLEIVNRIQRKCGKGFPILVRYSAVELLPGARELPESVEIAKMFEAAGVAALDVSCGIAEVFGPSISHYSEGWTTYMAEAIKAAVSIPVITAHALRNPEYCEKIISEGKADMVGFSRQLIADPYWANKAKAGKVNEIRRCVSCIIGCWSESLMIKRELRCTINPAIGDKRFLDITPADVSLNVAVVGGGVAGMEAARVAALRGHKVTLYEKENELGGAVRTCCMVPPKFRFKWYIDWLREQIQTLNVEIKLNTTATVDMVKGYDAVLCGTGAQLEKPDVVGIEKAISFEDVLTCAKKNCLYYPKEGKPMPVKTGERVVIWGDHYAASDLADTLGPQGKKVIIVTDDKEFFPNIEVNHREMLKMRFAGSNGHGLENPAPYKYPVEMHQKSTILEIRDGSVVVIDSNLKKKEIACDNVILAKVKPNAKLFEDLVEAGVKVANIGDSKQVRNVRGAMTDGTNVAYMLDSTIFMNANNHLSSKLPLDVRKMME